MARGRERSERERQACAWAEYSVVGARGSGLGVRRTFELPSSRPPELPTSRPPALQQEDPRESQEQEEPHAVGDEREHDARTLRGVAARSFEHQRNEDADERSDDEIE